jgi:hypothetical protein
MKGFLAGFVGIVLAVECTVGLECRSGVTSVRSEIPQRNKN